MIYGLYDDSKIIFSIQTLGIPSTFFSQIVKKVIF